jgi:hypothetical protein
MKTSKILVLLLMIALVGFLCHSIFIKKETFTAQNGIALLSLIISAITFFSKKEDSPIKRIDELKGKIQNLAFWFSSRSLNGFDGVIELNDRLSWPTSRSLRLHIDEIRIGHELISDNTTSLTSLFNDIIDEIGHNNSRPIKKYLKTAREGAIPKLANNVFQHLNRYYEGEELISTLDRVYALKGLARKVSEKLR